MNGATNAAAPKYTEYQTCRHEALSCRADLPSASNVLPETKRCDVLAARGAEAHRAKQTKAEITGFLCSVRCPIRGYLGADTGSGLCLLKQYAPPSKLLLTAQHSSRGCTFSTQSWPHVHAATQLILPSWGMM